MAQVDVTVTINRPIEEVFTALADTDHQSQWQPMVLETRKLSDGPVGVGTTYRYVGQFLGQRFETTGELTDYEPPRRYGWRVTTGPFAMRPSTPWRHRAAARGSRAPSSASQAASSS